MSRRLAAACSLHRLQTSSLFIQYDHDSQLDEMLSLRIECRFCSSRPLRWAVFSLSSGFCLTGPRAHFTVFLCVYFVIYTDTVRWTWYWSLILQALSSFSALTLLVGSWPVKNPSSRWLNVFGGTLKSLLNHLAGQCVQRRRKQTWYGHYGESPGLPIPFQLFIFPLPIPPLLSPPSSSLPSLRPIFSIPYFPFLSPSSPPFPCTFSLF